MVEFTQQLTAGWNLVSFPVASEDDTPKNLFEDNTMFYWDNIARNWVNITGSTTYSVELGSGYWVHLDSSTTVTVLL